MSDAPRMPAYEQARSVDNAVRMHQLILEQARESGMQVPFESDAEVRLRFLEYDLAKRDLQRRADAGDKQAKAQLIRDAAERELLLDELREVAAAEDEARRSSVQTLPADPARPWRTPQFWDFPAPVQAAGHG